MQKQAEQEDTTSLPNSRLLSAFDIESRQLRMSMLQSTRPKGEAIKPTSNYKAVKLSIDMNKIHYKDLMKLHQQSVNIIHRDMDIQHTTTEKLHKSLENITTQYMLEKVMTQGKNVKIKVLEKALLELSEDPGNMKHSQKMVKEKDKEITLLKQNIKIHRPHLATIEEEDAVLKVKEAKTKRFLVGEEKSHSYLTQIEYLRGKLNSLIAEAIPSATKRLSAGGLFLWDRMPMPLQLGTSFHLTFL